MLSSTEVHNTHKTLLKLLRKSIPTHISQEIHTRAITMFRKQSLQRLMDIRNSFSDVSLPHDGSSWKCIFVSVGAISLGEEEGPRRAQRMAFDAAKASTHAPLNTVYYNVKFMYTQ